MKAEGSRGRYRYILTRPCLDRGSLTLLKYLEPILPRTGQITFVGDMGEEISTSVDPKTSRIGGLGDYYVRNRLSVNDVLMLTVLEPSRIQLECLPRPREEVREAKPSPASTASPQRVVVAESAYVREVRTTRAEPFPAQLGGEDERSLTTEERSAQSKRPAGQPDASAKTVGRDKGTRKRGTARPAPAPLPFADDLLDSSQVTVVDKPMKPMTALEEARSVFTSFGYHVSEANQGENAMLILDAHLGRRSYTVLLAAPTQLSESALAVFEQTRVNTGARYLALVSDGAVLQAAGFAVVDRLCLSRLANLTKLAPVTPLDLEGYWNAGGLRSEAVESLELRVGDTLSARGAFSFTALSLSRFPAGGVITLAQVVEIVGGDLSEADARFTLETLSRPPFSLLEPLGAGEYLLRQGIAVAMENLAAFATGLRTRLEGPAKSEQPLEQVVARV